MMMDVVAAGLDRVHERIAGRFARAEPRARVREYVSGLVAGLERKNGWTLAEHAGEVCPDGMQRLLRRADWDVDGVRDDVRAYVIEQLGDKDGVLIAGAHGPRECHWARLPVRNGWKRGRGHWLLARRSLSDPEEIAYYACYGPRWSSTAGLAWTAGSRWHIEECIQQATGEAGLDHYQSAPGGPGMPYITLSVLALAWLAAARAQAGKGASAPATQA